LKSSSLSSSARKRDAERERLLRDSAEDRASADENQLE